MPVPAILGIGALQERRSAASFPVLALLVDLNGARLSPEGSFALELILQGGDFSRTSWLNPAGEPAVQSLGPLLKTLSGSLAERSDAELAPVGRPLLDVLIRNPSYLEAQPQLSVRLARLGGIPTPVPLRPVAAAARA